MADQENAPEEVAEKSGSSKGLILIVVVGIVCGGIGFAVPKLLLGSSAAEAKEKDVDPTKPGFIPFGETVVNIDEGRLNRYLRISITLQVDEEEVTELTELVEKRRAILKNWMLSYLSDRTMDEIRGAAGQNRLRRAILTNFNEVLAEKESDVIHDVLFEEFSIQ